MSERQPIGFPIVLTADRTLMADYRVLFDGMLSASQTTTTPELLVRLLLARPAWGGGVRARWCPIGLRRIEASLIEAGVSSDDVAVVSPMELPRAIGGRTRIIGVSTGDPLGLGMNTTTMTGIIGGRGYTGDWFALLMGRIRAFRACAPRARLIVGGPGAWQLDADPDARTRFDIDAVVVGSGERRIAELFVSVLKGGSLDEVTSLPRDLDSRIPAVHGATIMGVVEIGRGCGMGCAFCTIRDIPMRHVPAETVIADVRTNLRSGRRDVALISEDFFRYAGRPARSNPEALIDLLQRLRELDGLGLMQVDHANITSVACYSDEQLNRICRLLTGDAPKHSIWVNLGVETAVGPLLVANGGGPKIRPWSVKEWPDACIEQVRRLAAAGFLPMISLVMGLPGETRRDVEATRRWVERLRGERVLVFPLFHAPVSPGERPFAVRDMTEAHWRLLWTCYSFNFNRTLRLVWDNQTSAGVPLLRRLAIQALGRVNVLFWKLAFLWRSGGLCL